MEDARDDGVKRAGGVDCGGIVRHRPPGGPPASWSGSDGRLLARNAQKLRTACDELSVLGQVETAEIDLRDEEAVTNYIVKLDAETRHTKLLVNAAGSFKPTAFLDHSKADYDKYAVLNRSFFFITQAVARNMKRHG